jgi:hypothetical protein
MKTRWKIVIAIALGILVSYLWQHGDLSETRSERMGEVVVPTGSILWGEYQEYNKMYFGNTLPYVTLEYTRILDKDGEHDVMADVSHNASSYHIRIDKEFNPILKIADISLLHEICHIKLDASGEVPLTGTDEEAHGAKFQSCMMDLAARGAMKDLW